MHFMDAVDSGEEPSAFVTRQVALGYGIISYRGVYGHHSCRICNWGHIQYTANRYLVDFNGGLFKKARMYQLKKYLHAKIVENNSLLNIIY